MCPAKLLGRPDNVFTRHNYLEASTTLKTRKVKRENMWISKNDDAGSWKPSIHTCNTICCRSGLICSPGFRFTCRWSSINDDQNLFHLLQSLWLISAI